jgi:glutamate synthase (ferredoxin)
MLWWILGALLLVLALWALYDVTQRRHAIIRNFPIIGHFRYWLEAVGPELRQYIVTNNDEERPFSRDQRRWIYASSKKENNYFGFGSDNEMEIWPNYLIIKHSAFPLNDPHDSEVGYDPLHRIPCAKVLGGPRQRAKAFRPESIINISAMSFGSLSSKAIESLNRGAHLAQCMHNTGEGGVSPYHRKGGDLIWQIGTAYFGCRNEKGGFDIGKFLDVVSGAPIRAIEIKLSQGAKPGLGGVLPIAKITHELAEIRGIPQNQDCISPPAHTAFSDVDSMLDFVEMLAERTGLPVGIKSAVGGTEFWEDLANHMESGERGVDFITIDGGEGGTGAAPLAFTDHVSMPFRIGFTRAYRVFAQRKLHHRIVWIGSGRLGLPERAVFAMSVGADMINIAREAMLSIGCIQAQRCHTNHCPAGVATQNKWLIRGLDPDLKYVRCANYILTLRKELLRLTRACGIEHPGLLTSEHVEIIDEHFRGQTVEQLFGYEHHWGVPAEADCRMITDIMRARRLGQTSDESIAEEVSVSS